MQSEISRKHLICFNQLFKGFCFGYFEKLIENMKYISKDENFPRNLIL